MKQRIHLSVHPTILKALREQLAKPPKQSMSRWFECQAVAYSGKSMLQAKKGLDEIFAKENKTP